MIVTEKPTLTNPIEEAEVTYLIKKTTLKNMATEIRKLSGETGNLTPQNMIDKISEANETIAVQTDLINQLNEALENKVGSSSISFVKNSFPVSQLGSKGVAPGGEPGAELYQYTVPSDVNILIFFRKFPWDEEPTTYTFLSRMTKNKFGDETIGTDWIRDINNDGSIIHIYSAGPDWTYILPIKINFDAEEE